MIILPETSDSLHLLPIMQEQLVLCVPLQHPLREKKAVRFDQLKNENFILLHERAYQHQVVLSKCLRQHFVPNRIFTSNQIKTILGLIANGSGISFLMNMVVKNQPQIGLVPLADPITFDIGLAWKKDKYLSNASQALSISSPNATGLYQNLSSLANKTATTNAFCGRRFLFALIGKTYHLIEIPYFPSFLRVCYGKHRKVRLSNQSDPSESGGFLYDSERSQRKAPRRCRRRALY